jgi:pyruvate/2-oxoglutarate dehydrogenase complex dihydrolipoamide dehydrogenase (E3) component
MAHVTRIVIIGGGPGGYEAALVAAQLGAEVTVVDRDGLGGAAVLTDCVPSKTLIATAEVMTSFDSSYEELGIRVAADPSSARVVGVDLGKVNRRVKRLAVAQSHDITQSVTRAGVTLLRGFGRLEGGQEIDGSRAVVVDLVDGGTQTLRADAVLIATGNRPRELPEAKPDGERILTWTQLYDLDELPEELIVVGSGVTGAEFAGAYQALGSKVTLVSSRDRVLPGEDPDAAAVLEDVFKRRGMNVISRSRGEAARRVGDKVEVTLTGGQVITGSHVLMAVGSIPNTSGMGLEEAGVKLADGGQVKVDRVSRTSAPGVYAAGDCTGVLALASVAAMQGRIGRRGAAAQPEDRRGQRLHRPGDRRGRLQRRRRGVREDGRGLRQAAAARQPARQDAGHPRRFREAVLPPGYRDRRRRGGRRAARERADPPDLAGRRPQPDRRAGLRRVHGLPLGLRIDRRGSAPAAHPQTLRAGLTSPPTLVSPIWREREWVHAARIVPVRAAG